MGTVAPAIGVHLRTLRVGRKFESRIVWVLGSPRSGSTWLLRVLSDHDAVVPIDEPLIGWYLGPFLSDLPAWTGSDLEHQNFTLRRVQADKHDQFFADAFRDVWLPDLRRLMLRRFRAHVARHRFHQTRQSRAYAIIKEPNGSQSADILLAALPRSRLLFLLRDGRDVVDSELAANLAGSWVTHTFPGAKGISDEQRLAFVSASARRWLWRTEVVEHAFRAHPGPKLMARYEDVLADPPVQFRKLLDWMGLQMGDAELEQLVERHAFENIPASERGAQKFHRAATPGLWRESLTPDEQAVVEQVIGPKLGELGYAGSGVSA